MSLSRFELVKVIQEKLMEAICEEDDRKLADVYFDLTGNHVDDYKGDFHHTDDEGWID
jgi:hypothetical protein